MSSAAEARYGTLADIAHKDQKGPSGTKKGQKKDYERLKGNKDYKRNNRGHLQFLEVQPIGVISDSSPGAS